MKKTKIERVIDTMNRVTGTYTVDEWSALSDCSRTAVSNATASNPEYKVRVRLLRKRLCFKMNYNEIIERLKEIGRPFYLIPEAAKILGLKEQQVRSIKSANKEINKLIIGINEYNKSKFIQKFKDHYKGVPNTCATWAKELNEDLEAVLRYKAMINTMYNDEVIVNQNKYRYKQISAMYQRGDSISEIAWKIGISISAVSHFITRHNLER